MWSGALRDPSGYADEARAFVLALARSGYAPVAREQRWTTLDAEMTPVQRTAIAQAVARAVPPSPFVVVHHMAAHLAPRPNTEGPTVIRTMFETDRVPADWLGALITADEVWVPTDWNVETFQRSGVPAEKLRVLPGTLDFELFDPAATMPVPIDGARGFTFLTSFDFSDRKGWDVLLDAWADAFDPDEDVSLVLKCLALEVPVAEIEERIKAHLGSRRTAPILLDIRLLSASALPGLYRAADAFVLASRGEGWGRPLMEAMAMGLPTIGPRSGGNLGFMNDRNSWLVDGAVVSIPASAKLHSEVYRGHRWFEPDRDSLVSILRDVACRGADSPRAVGARADLMERFGNQVVADRIAELTLDLLGRWSLARSKPVACVWRGDWGGRSSLSVVNDGLVGEIESAGQVVERIVPDVLSLPTAAVGVSHQWPPSFTAPADGPLVFFQPWECSRVPIRWVDQIRECVDEVWAYSEFSRRAYIASGVPEELVHLVRCGVNLETFSPDGPAYPLPARAETVFLFVGATIFRKGIDVLLSAYASAFGAADDVLLVVKTFEAAGFYEGLTANALVAKLEALPGAPAVLLLDEAVGFDEMPSLYRAADVLVQPYRGEGFCLPALEALACGRPVIVTKSGPTDDFVTDACGWRIPSAPVPVPETWLSASHAIGDEGAILEPDLNALIGILREAASPEIRAEKAAAARPQAEQFSWAHAAASAIERLEALQDRTPVRMHGMATVPGRKGTLFAVTSEWHRPETWAPAVIAYARAFAPDADTSLAMLASDPEAAAVLVGRQLEEAGLRLDAIADIVLLDGGIEPSALELAADYVIVPNGYRPIRARRVVSADPAALRESAGCR
jgi:glycosyltransferase involved in cell wall biosynthesis